MKRTLLATTALVAMGGTAYADVSLSGYAELGIIGGDPYGNNTQFHTDIDVTFTLSGTTDNGLTFGASIDLDESDGSGTSVSSPAFGNTTQGGESLFISGAFGTLSMGDTDGAFDRGMIEVGAGTSIADDHTTHSGYSGNSGLDGFYDGQIARYDYSFGDFAIAASLEVDDTGVGDPVYGIGGSWKSNVNGTNIGLGAGYQTVDPGGSAPTVDIWGLSASASMANGIKGVINYSDHSTKGNLVAFSLTYTSGPILVTANYGTWDTGSNNNNEGVGAAFNYDLGGGAVFMAGYGHSNPGSPGPDVDQWSVGFGLSF